MKQERLFDAITDIRDDFIIKTKKRSRKWIPAVAAAAAIVLVVTALIFPKGNAPTFLSIEAVYPEIPPRPSYEDYESYEAYEEAYDLWFADYGHYTTYMNPKTAESLTPFFAAALPSLLEGEGNRACSPLTLYMSLAMLAEISGGSTQAQLLELLNAEDTETLRTVAKEVWEKNYSTNDPKLLLANSLWMSEDLNLREAPLQALATDYYASSYQGKMGSKKMNDLLREWLNKQTGGLLEEQAEGLTLSPQTALALVSTVYLSGKWDTPFSSANTRVQTFHAPDGDQQCDFLNEGYTQRPYYWGENFTATTKRLDGCYMTFLLPDEGYTVEELLRDDTAIAFLSGDPDAAECRYMDVSLSVPKFDIAAKTELNSALQSLGITEAFKSEADFTPLTDVPLFVSSVQHGARIAIDEEGCVAAAYTKIDIDTGDAPPEELKQIDFVADRPFILTVSATEGPILFAGVVSNP